MLGSIQGLGKQSYGLLYIVPATYLYLLTTDALVSIPFVKSISPEIVTTLLLFLSLYTVIWLHHSSLLIFGDHAGLASTRKSKISNKHMVFFATGVKPKELPDTGSMLLLIKKAVTSDNVRLGVFFRFIPAGFFFLYQFVAWIWLSSLLVNNNGSLITGALWLGLTVMVFQKRVVGYLPNYIPPESVEEIDEAEYMVTHRNAQKSDDKTNHQPRIRKQ